MPEGAPGLPPLVVPPESDVPGLTDSVRSGPEVDSGLLRLLPLLGTWRGRGKGSRLDGTEFDYGQQMRFAHDGRSVLEYASVVWLLRPAGQPAESPQHPDSEEKEDATGQPGPVAGRERGIWRPRALEPDGIEALVVHDEGLTELTVGQVVSGTRFELRSDVLTRTETAPEVTVIHRLFGLVEGDLMYAWDRAIGEDPRPTPYMSARLRRVSDALQVRPG